MKKLFIFLIAAILSLPVICQNTYISGHSTINDPGIYKWYPRVVDTVIWYSNPSTNGTFNIHTHWSSSSIAGRICVVHAPKPVDSLISYMNIDTFVIANGAYGRRNHTFEGNFKSGEYIGLRIKITTASGWLWQYTEFKPFSSKLF